MLCVDSDYQPDLFLTPLDLVDEILIRIWKMLEFKTNLWCIYSKIIQNVYRRIMLQFGLLLPLKGLFIILPINFHHSNSILE